MHPKVKAALDKMEADMRARGREREMTSKRLEQERLSEEEECAEKPDKGWLN